MSDKRDKIINMLDNVIRISTTLHSSGLVEASSGDEILRTLKGIRSRFCSPTYMSQSPKGILVDEIDEMLLPLDRLLLEAGKKRYKNTISCILDSVIYGTGICHRILTAEEKQQESYVLMQRKMKLDEYLDKIVTAKKLDEKLSSQMFVQARRNMLEKNYEAYQKKVDYFRQYRPNITEELLYYTDPEEMSPEAQEYLRLNQALRRIQSEIEESQKSLRNMEHLVESYRAVLCSAESEAVTTEAEAGQILKSQQASALTMVQEEASEASKMSELSDKNENSVCDEKAIREKMQEIQKLAQNLVAQRGPSVIDLEYEAMERVFSSQEMRDYVANSFREFEACGLADLIKVDWEDE